MLRVVDATQPTDRDRQALGRCEALDGVDPRLLDRVFGSMQLRSYAVGEHLIRQGEEADCLLVIVEGKAALRLQDHGKQHHLGGFGPANVVGEMALITREPRSADVVASTAVRALALPAEDFHELARDHTELGIVLTRLIADRLGHSVHDGLGGKIAGGYQILRCVGRGGMAIVYEAERGESGQRVALKMMSHRLLYEPGGLSRFRQEAAVVRTLEHENIVRLYESFSAFKTEFLVLEFCDGPTLSRLTQSGRPLPERQVRRILGQLARALHYTHERGIVHRDLKPGNVMLTHDGIVKLSDFGIVRPNYELTEATQTVPGSIIGTPTYMPPEQMEGETVDPRADIYALGCVGYELASGQRTFPGKGMMELVQQKLCFVMPLPAEIGDGVSDELHGLLERALRNDLGERLDSVEPFIEWAGPVDMSASADGGWTSRGRGTGRRR
jgi:hypothetical protein